MVEGVGILKELLHDQTVLRSFVIEDTTAKTDAIFSIHRNEGLRVAITNLFGNNQASI